MGWGQVPSEARAAEEARAAAIEAADSRPMSPFERKLIGVLEDIRDKVADCAPVPLEPIVGVASATGGGLDPLLDAPPAVLARAIAAGGQGIAAGAPMLREDFTASGFEKLAELAIEAALHEAARDRDAEADMLLDAADRPPAWRVGGPSDTSPVEQQPADEPGAGEVVPPAAPAPGAPRRITDNPQA